MIDGEKWRKKEEEVRWTDKYGGRMMKKYDGQSGMEEEIIIIITDGETWRKKEKEVSWTE